MCTIEFRGRFWLPLACCFRKWDSYLSLVLYFFYTYFKDFSISSLKFSSARESSTKPVTNIARALLLNISGVNYLFQIWEGCPLSSMIMYLFPSLLLYFPKLFTPNKILQFLALHMTALSINSPMAEKGNDSGSRCFLNCYALRNGGLLFTEARLNDSCLLPHRSQSTGGACSLVALRSF